MFNKFLVIDFVLIYLNFSCAFYRIGKKSFQPADFRKRFPYGRLKTQVAITDDLKKLVNVENALLEEECVIGEAQGNRNNLNYQGRNFGKVVVSSKDGGSKFFASSKYRSLDKSGGRNMVNPIHNKFIVEKGNRGSNITRDKYMFSTSKNSKLAFQLLVASMLGARPSESNSKRRTWLLQIGKLENDILKSGNEVNILQDTRHKLNVYKTFNIRVSRMIEQNAKNNEKLERNLCTKELKKNIVERDVPAEGPYGLVENGLA